MLDFFAGSGTTGIAAAELGRDFLLVDSNPEAIAVMRQRFAGMPEVEWRSGGETAGDGGPDIGVDADDLITHQTEGSQ